MEEEVIVASLAALAQPMRLRAYRALVVAGEAGMTPGAMAETLSVPASTLSFHLKELTRADLISQERDGRHLVYRARFEHMNGLISYLTEHCCAGQPCLTAPLPVCAGARACPPSSNRPARRTSS